MSKVRVYDDAGNVIETHEHRAGLKSPKTFRRVNHWLWSLRERLIVHL